MSDHPTSSGQAAIPAGIGHRWFDTIRSRLFLLLIGTALPVLLAQFLLYNTRVATMRAHELEVNTELARLAASSFDRYIDEILRQEALITDFLAYREQFSPERVTPLLSMIKAQSPATDQIMLTDSSGVIIASTFPDSVGMSLADRPYIGWILSGSEWSIGGLVITRDNQQPRFTIGRAKRDPEGKIMAIAVVTIDPDKLDDIFGIERSRGGRLTLIDSEGIVVYRYPHPDWSWERRKYLRDVPELRAALRGEEAGEVTTVDPEGNRIRAFVPVRAIGWVVATSQLEKTLMATAVAELRSDVAITVLVCLLALVAALLVGRNITEPVIRLRQHASALGRGDFSQRAVGKGPSELRVLAAAFNTMAEEIAIRAEDLRSAHDELESRVQERTNELSLAYEALRDSNTLLQLVLDTLPVGVWLTDERGAIRSGNQAAKDIWAGARYVDTGGYHEYKAWWADTGELIAPEDWAAARAIRRGEVSINELIEIEAFDGSRRFILNSSAPVINEGGRIIGAIVVNQDVTEKRRAEVSLKEYSEKLEDMVQRRTAELKEAQEQLVRRERLAILGQLAGGVGHELRNPLGAIKSAVYLIGMIIENPEPDLREALQILEKEIGRSEKIISSLLDFARPRPPDVRQVELEMLVRQCVAEVRIPQKIEIEWSAAPDIPSVGADPDQLAQVFGNIVRNAVQSMRDGGKLAITILRRPEGYVEVSFTDTGPGIPEEQLDKLFEPLFTTRVKGIGLGLAVAKAITERHGGTLTASSAGPGMGSNFTVRLPERPE